MTSEGTSGRTDPGSKVGKRTKVERVIETYELDGLGAELERRWTDRGPDRMSLRELADHFNAALLRSALEANGERPVAGEVENLVRLLQTDEATGAARAQAEAKLQRIGIDIEELRADFVSHQAVHTYLTDVRGVQARWSDDPDDDPVEQREATIQRLRNRLVAVAEQSLDALSSNGHLSVGSVDVLVSVSVYCDECETSYQLEDLLDRGGCGCRDAG